MSRVVVTGASGNVGSALVSRLASVEDVEVVGISRRRPSGSSPWAGLEWHEVDLAAPSAVAALDRACAGADAVVHLAWGFQPSRDLDYLNRLAIDGTAAVLDAAARAGVRHVVHMSSLGAYSPAPDGVRVDEDWPTEGVPGSLYSAQKAAAERLLDVYEPLEQLTVTRLRPGLVLQPSAAGSLLRYGVPTWVPAALLGHVPVLPLDSALAIQVVHADDLADAVVSVLDQRVAGAFNLAAEPVVDRDLIASVLSARPVQVPRHVLRSVVDVSWRLRVQALDPGWVDLAFDSPLMDTTRARRELGWSLRHDARSALSSTLRAMADSAGGPGPVLRPRRWSDQMRRVARSGTVGRRRVP